MYTPTNANSSFSTRLVIDLAKPKLLVACD